MLEEILAGILKGVVEDVLIGIHGHQLTSMRALDWIKTLHQSKRLLEGI